jgi:hypothetical protein
MGLDGKDQPGDHSSRRWAQPLETRLVGRCYHGGAQGGWILVERGGGWRVETSQEIGSLEAAGAKGALGKHWKEIKEA